MRYRASGYGLAVGNLSNTGAPLCQPSMPRYTGSTPARSRVCHVHQGIAPRRSTQLHPSRCGLPAKSRPATKDPPMHEFQVVSDFTPQGDQPAAIARLAEGVRAGERHQTLLGVTGSGKTFTMCHVVQDIQRPTLVLAPNKTLAAQLYSEFKRVLPQQCGRVLRQLLRLLSAGGVHRPRAISSSRRSRRSTRRSRSSGCPPPARCSSGATC